MGNVLEVSHLIAIPGLSSSQFSDSDPDLNPAEATSFVHIVVLWEAPGVYSPEPR